MSTFTVPKAENSTYTRYSIRRTSLVYISFLFYSRHSIWQTSPVYISFLFYSRHSIRRTSPVYISFLFYSRLCVIYPLFVPYYCDIPRVALSHLWGIPMTGKSLSYILGLQAASSSPESIVMALCGLVSETCLMSLCPSIVYQRNREEFYGIEYLAFGN